MRIYVLLDFQIGAPGECCPHQHQLPDHTTQRRFFLGIWQGTYHQEVTGTGLD